MYCYLTEFDSSPAIIEPGQLIQPVPGFPRVVIATFTGELLHQLADADGIAVAAAAAGQAEAQAQAQNQRQKNSNSFFHLFFLQTIFS